MGCYVGWRAVQRHLSLGPHVGNGSELDPYQIAELAGGTARALDASLAELRAARLVYADGHDLLRAAPGDPPASASPMVRVVYESIASGRTSRRDVSFDPRIWTASDGVGGSVAQLGWLIPSGQRRRMRAGGWALIALALGGSALTMGRMGAAEHPDEFGFGVLVAVIATGQGVSLLSVPRGVRSTPRLIASLRARNAHLSPGRLSTWDDPHEAGLSVALFGTEAIWSVDPDFARRANISRQASGRAATSVGGLPLEWDHDGAGGGRSRR